jgi:RNase P/RNase MRP subunit POP5
MKKLKPSHREKKRYLLLKGKDVNKKEIDKSILKYMGELGYAKASPEIVNNFKEGVIIAINRKEIDKVRVGFLLSKKDINIVKVSGSLKKLK